MYSKELIGRFGYSIPQKDLEYLGSDGISRDETKSDFYWHPQHLLVVHHWGNLYKVHPQEVINELRKVIKSNTPYASQQGDYGNWEPTQRLTNMNLLIDKIDVQWKLEAW